MSIDVFLAANATVSAEAPFLDCVLDRDFRMRSLLPPKVIGEDEDRPDGFIAKFLDSLDSEVNNAFARVDCFPTIIDPLRAPSEFLDLLLYNLGSPFTLEEGLTDTEKRRLALVLFTMYALKGTCFGLIGAVKIIYGINVTECIAANVDCWELNVDELNISTDLCPSNAFERRAFSIMVDVNLTDKQRQQITNIANWIKPANTHFAGIVEPGNPNWTDHWELEFSELNFNTDLH
jgi:phage tail-like protein